MFEAYLEQYPEGAFAVLAKVKKAQYEKKLPPIDLAKAGPVLSAAATTGDARAVEELLSRGVSPNMMIKFSHPRFARGRTIHSTAITAATVFRQASVVRLLLDKGASPMQPENAFALCPAVAYGHVAIVKMLVDSGVDVNVGPKCFKRATPLELARKRVFSEIVVLLEAAGAK